MARPEQKVEKLKSASEMAQEMAETILNDFDFEEGKEVAVMLSGLWSNTSDGIICALR